MEPPLPKKFFVVTGKGLSNTSGLNAFDRALVNARIGQCNLAPVSSILPPDAVPVKYEHIPPGTITFCVLSRFDGTSGDSISAGIGWASCEITDTKEKLGIVAEAQGKKSEAEVDSEIKEKLRDMADARGMGIKEVSVKKTSIVDVPEDTFASVIAALVYVP